MNFKIPKKFQLAGQTINVYKVENITKQTEDVDGMAFYCKNKIEIKDDKDSTDQYMELVFWHEYFHHLLNTMGEKELRSNEKFIDLIANLQMQAIRTME